MVPKRYVASVEEARAVTRVLCEGKGRTVQSMKEDADINVIVARFLKTKQLPLQLRPVVTEDFVGVFDFQTAQNKIIEARRLFDSLPSKVRSRFENDPRQFVEFCSDEKNLPAMREMGLAVPEAKPESVAPVPQPAAKADG